MPPQVCTDICWALRHIAPNESNRGRVADEFGPEKVLVVLRSFYKELPFALEASKALVSFVESESDDLIIRIVSSNAIPLFVKAMKKFYQDSEGLSRWVLNLFYLMSCNDKLLLKLSSPDILDLLSLTLEAHAGAEGVAEWGCRMVHNLLVGNAAVTSRMRSAGLCEMVVSCVQRQAISTSVCGYGCLAIGDLATDKGNHDKLTSAGACEAVVGSLRRHDDDPELVCQTCHAIHYLAQTDYNTGWVGANGGCEAVTVALTKHTPTSVAATRHCLRAIGSLAFNDEGTSCPCIADYDIVDVLC